MDAARGGKVNDPKGARDLAFFNDYARRLQGVLSGADWSGVGRLAQAMHRCWQEGRSVFWCGNGGSAGNAIHLVNDYLYGAAKDRGRGMKAYALSANPAVLTCLANDLGYDRIFSEQLAVLGEAGDVLVVLSGSGNSPNILRVLEIAREKGIESYAILGYTGGKAKALADVAIHFAVDDMQVSEDMQLVVGHMIMQWLHQNPPARME
jgi:D-sedoheptulose 7-phosphate isomerase